MSAAPLLFSGNQLRLRFALLCALCCSLSGCSANESATAEPPSLRCASCHLQEYQATSHPPHPGVRPTTCGVCHGEAGWHPARSALVHSFPLQGGHAKAACFACHRGPTPTFEGTTNQCSVCHQTEHTSANAKVEHHASFSSQCETCHGTTAWKPTLPHDEAFADAPPDAEAPARSAPVPRAAGSAGPASKPAPSKTLPAGSAAWSNKAPSNPSKPDQISGASRVKKR